MNKHEEVMNACHEMLSQGASLDEVLLAMRKRRLSKIESIKALVDLGQGSLAEAKEIVHHSRAWADVKGPHEEFQGELLSNLERRDGDR